MTSIDSILLIITLGALATGSNIGSTRQDIQLSDDGGYTDVLIAIHDSVSEDRSILQAIKVSYVYVHTFSYVISCRPDICGLQHYVKNIKKCHLITCVIIVIHVCKKWVNQVLTYPTGRKHLMELDFDIFAYGKSPKFKFHVIFF